MSPVKILFQITVIMLLGICIVSAETVGDINNDGKVDLKEAIYALQVVSGIQPELSTVSAGIAGDINHDEKIDLIEAIYALQASLLSDKERATGVSEYYLPEKLSFISWDFPNVVHTGIDIDYKMTGYDWFNRTLGWSVDSGPSGMTIDTDGTIHWTPSVDGTTEEVTIGLTFNGRDKITKTFTITIENSRCYFIATNGSDTTGDGSLHNPFASREKVVESAAGDTDGKTIFIRGGTYSLTDQHWNTDGNILKKFCNKNWNDDDHLLWRNYPGEDVTLSIVNGTAFRQYGKNVTYMGINAQGGTTGETGSWTVAHGQVAKLCTASGYRCKRDYNPHGFHVSHGAIIDSCTAWDNKDEDEPDHINNANFNLYPKYDKAHGQAGEIFVIDCIGEGQSAYNFKTKKVEGALPVVFHNCISYGVGTGGFMTYNNRQSIRHSWSVMESGGKDKKNLYLGGGSSYPGHTDGGGLTQHCLFVNHGSNNTTWQNGFVFGSLPETPSILDSNTIIVAGSGDGNLFRLANPHSSESTWTMKWTDNKVYLESLSNAIDIDTIQDFSVLNTVYGSGNSLLLSKGSYSKTVQGRTFHYNNGVFSENKLEHQ